MIWLPRGLTRDYGEFGTRGHVDIVAAFVRPASWSCTPSPTPRTPTTRSARRTRALLRAATDAQGRRLEVVELPAPTILTEADGEPVDYSYINHYVGNGVVLLCAFDDPRDQEAAAVLGKLSARAAPSSSSTPARSSSAAAASTASPSSSRRRRGRAARPAPGETRQPFSEAFHSAFE